MPLTQHYILFTGTHQRNSSNTSLSGKAGFLLSYLCFVPQKPRESHVSCDFNYRAGSRRPTPAATQHGLGRLSGCCSFPFTPVSSVICAAVCGVSEAIPNFSWNKAGQKNRVKDIDPSPAFSFLPVTWFSDPFSFRS